MDWPHWIILPIVVPLMAGALLVLLEARRPALARVISLASLGALLLIATLLVYLAHSSGSVQAYLLGNWRAPFGIALALDRLSALLLLLTSLVGGAALLYAQIGRASCRERV